jgi:hypothetical protein
MLRIGRLNIIVDLCMTRTLTANPLIKRAEMKSLYLAIFLLASNYVCFGQTNRTAEMTAPQIVADSFFWFQSEGNIGFEIFGKFQSEDQLRATLGFSADIGSFKAKKYPFAPTRWELRDILLSMEFGGGGSTAIWKVSGPKPLLLDYLDRLKRQHEDRSLFYDFGYKTINYKPTHDHESK